MSTIIKFSSYKAAVRIEDKLISAVSDCSISEWGHGELEFTAIFNPEDAVHQLLLGFTRSRVPQFFTVKPPEALPHMKEFSVHGPVYSQLTFDSNKMVRLSVRVVGEAAS